MSVLARVKLSEEDSLKLQKLNYECSGLKLLVSQFGSDTKFKPDMDRFSLVAESYLSSYAEYNYTLRALSKDYVSIDILSTPSITVDTDFIFSEIIISMGGCRT